MPPVEADPFRLQQVLANLVGNAIKYTPANGRIWIRASRQPDAVVVGVTDTGIGISPADLPQVFDKFYRCHNPQAIEQDGSGLGLAIVKSIIAEHGGKVWVESTLGKGSTFYFSLPLPEESSPSQTGSVK
jgi:signal transduction histidine kinase